MNSRGWGYSRSWGIQRTVKRTVLQIYQFIEVLKTLEEEEKNISIKVMI